MESLEGGKSVDCTVTVCGRAKGMSSGSLEGNAGGSGVNRGSMANATLPSEEFQLRET